MKTRRRTRMKTRKKIRRRTRKKIRRKTRKKTGGEEEIVWKKHRCKTYYYINYYQPQTLSLIHI